MLTFVFVASESDKTNLLATNESWTKAILLLSFVTRNITINIRQEFETRSVFDIANGHRMLDGALLPSADMTWLEKESRVIVRVDCFAVFFSTRLDEPNRTNAGKLRCDDFARVHDSYDCLHTLLLAERSTMIAFGESMFVDLVVCRRRRRRRRRRVRAQIDGERFVGDAAWLDTQRPVVVGQTATNVITYVC